MNFKFLRKPLTSEQIEENRKWVGTFGERIDVRYDVVSKDMLGKDHYCPYYIAWSQMLHNAHIQQISVDPEWLSLRKFTRWAETSRDIETYNVQTEHGQPIGPKTSTFTTVLQARTKESRIAIEDFFIERRAYLDSKEIWD